MLLQHSYTIIAIVVLDVVVVALRITRYGICVQQQLELLYSIHMWTTKLSVAGHIADIQRGYGILGVFSRNDDGDHHQRLRNKT